jgi:hypothetical protein
MPALQGPGVIQPALLKLELAVRGARLDSSVSLPRSIEPVRSLDLVLPGDVWVDVPVDERRAAGSPFLLLADDRHHVLVRQQENGADALRTDVRALPRPRFAERRTSRGIPMVQIATMRGSHLVVTLGGSCGFSVRGAPCRFCVEGARASVDDDAPPVTDVIEVVRAAFDEVACTSVYFNSSHFDGDDGGVAFLTPYVEAVRRHFDTLVALQVHPPRSDRWIDHTYAMGVDALSYNLEIFDADLLNRHCIGRSRYIGRERYLDALGYAARIFPSGTVWTDLALGIEPADSTIAGIDALVAAGVVPVAAILRGEHAMPDVAEAARVLDHLYRAVRRQGLSMLWVRGLGLGITPMEARHFAGDGARLTATVHQLARSRIGALAARGLARVRRRLRVRKADDAEAAQL